jgi:peroxiredoxin
MHKGVRIFTLSLFCALIVLIITLTACAAAPESIQINNKVPSFKLTDRQGNMVSLSDHKGKIVFLHFWNTTFDYCSESLPFLQELFKQWSKTGDIVLLTIDEAESASTVNAFMDKYKYDFPVLLDSDNQIAGKYSVNRIPISFLINPDGRLKMKVAGPFEDKAAIEKMVSGAIAAK